jgi:protocatechuate 3,4-dioxygenase beta subunit
MRSNPLAIFSREQVASFPFLLYLLIALFLNTSGVARAQETARSNRVTIEDSNAAGGAPGSITGRVTGDDGRPLGDIQVFVYGAYTNTSPRSVQTDAGGRFQFQDLSPGLYTLRASTPAYVQLPEENVNPFEPRYLRPGDSAQLTMVRGGVITGTVLNAQGEPVIGASVRALRVRDGQGRRVAMDSGFGGMPRMTDDRGVYRIYGLQPGSYVVVVGGGTPYYIGMPNIYENESPTYYPSATRDTAAEVSVRTGEEATGVDVRYRGERGHTISGTVSGAPKNPGRFSLNVTLTRAGTGTFEAQTFVLDINGRRVFSLNGVADGEYEIAAQGYLDRSDVIAAAPRRITVRGSDITGLELALAQMANITGRITLELSQDEACRKTTLNAAMQQTLVSVRRDDIGKERLQTPPFYTGGNVPNEQGEFLIRNLSAGLFRLSVRPPGDDWYVRALSLPMLAQAKAAEAKAAPAPLPGTIAVKTGERLSGITINLAQGAARLSGRVTAQAEGASLPASLRAYLVPTERERAGDILRYAEANVFADGTFSFTSLAPGRYWIVLKPAPQSSDALLPPRMLAWDEEGRKTIRREAETANNVLELKPCQRVTDYSLSYAAK